MFKKLPILLFSTAWWIPFSLALTSRKSWLQRRFAVKRSVMSVLDAATSTATATSLSEPILRPSPCDVNDPIQFDTGGVANPVILPPNQDNPKWQCYYYGNPGSWMENHKGFIPTGWCGLAESDDGIHWSKVPGNLEFGSILAPSGGDEWDGIQIGVGDVIRVGPGELHMYYFGGSNEELSMGTPGASVSTVGFRMRIGRAKSLDGGKTWEKMGVCLDYDKDEGMFAAWPRIIVPDKNKEPWRMIYHSFTGQKWRVYGATSTDKGESWSRTGLILEGGKDEENSFDYVGIGTRDMTPWKDGMLMIYEGVDAKGVHRFGGAYCKDNSGAGTWEKLESGQPILEPAKGPMGAWTSMVIGTPYVISLPDGSLRLYHCGRRDAENGMEIGVLISDSGDISAESWRAVSTNLES